MANQASSNPKRRLTVDEKIRKQNLDFMRSLAKKPIVGANQPAKQNSLSKSSLVGGGVPPVIQQPSALQIPKKQSNRTNARLNEGTARLEAPREEQNGGTEKKIMHAAGTATKAAGTGAQVAGAGAQVAGKGIQAAGAGVEAAGKGVQAAGKGLQLAGKTMAAIPVVGTVLGGITAGAGTAVQGAGKGVEATGKGVKAVGKAVNKAGQATKKTGGQMKKLGKKAHDLEQELPQKESFEPNQDIAQLFGLRKNTLNRNRQHNMIQNNASQISLKQNPLNQKREKKDQKENEEKEEEEEEEEEDDDDDDDEDEEEEEEEEEAQKMSFQSMMQMVKIQGALSDAMGIKQQQIIKTIGASKEDLKTKHKATDMAVNSICNFDPTFCVLRLLWMNIKMVYGSWIKKGKDSLIPPLSWDPIPMPVDKKAILLQGLVITADIAVIAIFLMIIGFFLIIIKQIMDVVKAVK